MKCFDNKHKNKRAYSTMFGLWKWLQCERRQMGDSQSKQ